MSFVVALIVLIGGAELVLQKKGVVSHWQQQDPRSNASARPDI
jgi:hypothetical protein